MWLIRQNELVVIHNDGVDELISLLSSKDKDKNRDEQKELVVTETQHKVSSPVSKTTFSGPDLSITQVSDSPHDEQLSLYELYMIKELVEVRSTYPYRLSYKQFFDIADAGWEFATMNPNNANNDVKKLDYDKFNAETDMFEDIISSINDQHSS